MEIPVMTNLVNGPISQYIWYGSHRKHMKLSRIWMEVIELWEAILALDWANLKEEIGDVVLFTQMWAWWTFTLDNHVWWLGRGSAQKFLNRRPVWADIYEAAGLPRNIDGSSANYRKLDKVVKRLGQLGVDRNTAIAAYEKIVKPAGTTTAQDASPGNRELREG